jgi:hypothetical protein
MGRTVFTLRLECAGHLEDTEANPLLRAIDGGWRSLGPEVRVWVVHPLRFLQRVRTLTFVCNIPTR